MHAALGGAFAADRKKAIVLASFGTAFKESREKNIDSFEVLVKDAFPDYIVRLAFTSRFIIRKLTGQGIYVDSLEMVLADLTAKGYQDIIIQSLHLTAGEEYENKVLRIAEQYRDAFCTLRVGRPAMMGNGEVDSHQESTDFIKIKEALQQQMPVLEFGQHIVLMGHGSPHRHNPAYEKLQAVFDRAGLPVTIGVLEENDSPNIEAVLRRLKGNKNVSAVILMPLLLNAGDHVLNDMAGTKPASWKSQLLQAGYQVTVYMHGLGENLAVQRIYLQHIQDAIEGENSLIIK